MSKFNNSNSPIESQCGELYKLTFPDGNGIEDSFRYFSQDIGSQTEESEIIQVFELTEALAKLTSDNANLHRNFNLVRSTLQSEFHRRLTNASDQLYSRMNQRLDDVERSQRDRVEVVRRAFRTQLSDALSHMASLYQKKLQSKSLNDRSLQESEEAKKYKRIIDDLILKLKKSEVKVKELNKQITEYQELEAQPTMILDSDSERSEKIIIDDEENLKTEEINRQNDLIMELNQKIEDLNKQNLYYLTKVENLNDDIKNLNLKLDSAIENRDQLKSENELMVIKYENLVKQNTDMKVEQNQPKIKPEKPKHKVCNVQKNQKEFPDMSKDVLKLKDTIQLLQNKEADGMKQFNKLKNDLLSENKSYSEQVNILQSINKKLKEEMFQRKEAVNNFGTLHSASVAYAKDKQPMGILPNYYSEDTRPVNNIGGLLTNYTSPFAEINNDLLNNFVELKM